MLPWLSNLHVFSFLDGERQLLETAHNEWSRYIDMANTLDGDRYALIEFTREGKTESFLKDAATLNVV